MGVKQALKALSTSLNDPNRNVAIAAAFALASLGNEGAAMLENAVLSPARAAASVAFEALEKSALGLVELA
jgi:HEAT repeat protein